MTEHKWNVDRYRANAAYVPNLGMSVVELLNPQTGERILDLGCGDGTLTERIAVVGCDVVAVDESCEMVEAASCRGIDARVMDGHALSFDDEFDAIFYQMQLCTG